MIDFLRWLCPGCGKRNDDEIDPILGPFNSCTCGDCGRTFDQDVVLTVD